MQPKQRKVKLLVGSEYVSKMVAWITGKVSVWGPVGLKRESRIVASLTAGILKTKNQFELSTSPFLQHKDLPGNFLQSKI